MREKRSIDLGVRRREKKNLYLIQWLGFSVNPMDVVLTSIIKYKMKMKREWNSGRGERAAGYKREWGGNLVELK